MRIFEKDRWGEIFEVLTSNWMRTILTAFGVFWGIFILVILLSASRGLEQGIRKGFGSIATNTLFVWSQTASKDYKGMKKGRPIEFKNSDVTLIKNEVKGLEIISPRNQLGNWNGAANVVRGINTAAFTVFGDYPDFIKQEPMDIIKGRFINQNDIDEYSKTCVIGQGVINKLYKQNESVLGTYVKINNIYFKVIGVYKKRSQNNPESQNSIFAPFTTFQQSFNYGDKVSWFAITANDSIPITALKDKIFTTLRQRHSIHPDDNRAIGNFDLSEEFKKINMLFFTLKMAGYIVGLLILISGIIGISNIMLIVVKERAKEIGIRRALGAKPAIIRFQIISESLILTIVSGMAGISFATFILFIVNNILDSMPSSNMMFANPGVSLLTIIIALLILVFFGAFAGYIPAQTALKIKPIEALKDE